MHTNAYTCWADNCPYTSGRPSKNCRIQGPTQDPNAPRLKTNVSQKIEEVQVDILNFCQATPLVVFHQDTPAFSPRILPRGDDRPALPTHTDTAYAPPELTKIAAPDPAAPAAIGTSKINSNCAQPMEGQNASPSLPADQDSDVMLVASIGESDGDSDYVELAKNSPTSPSNTLSLEGHISELEEMHEVAEGKLV